MICGGFGVGIAMGRRRVLVLAPAITRMQCMSNPYKRVKDVGAEGKEEGEGGAVVRRGSFWSSWSWRKRKAVKREGKGTRKRWGFRVSKLRIRMLSPGYWLKKLRDSYINMMLAIERNAPMDCSGMVTYPSHIAPQSQYLGGGASGAWIWPSLPPPVVI